MTKRNKEVINDRDYWEIIKYNYDQIRFAEVKASIIISIYSLFFSIAYTIDVLDEENSYNFDFNNIINIILLIILIPGLYFTIIAVASCVKCFLPRLNLSTEKSPLFFGDIGTGYKNFNHYMGELNSLMDSEKDYHKHLSQMIYVTGIIAQTKFSNVNRGIRSLLRSLFFYTVFIIGMVFL